jgi:hypothetical protein
MCKFARKYSPFTFLFCFLISHFAFAEDAGYKSVRIYQGSCSQALAYSKDATANCPPVFAIIHRDDKIAYINITQQDQTFISLSVNAKKDSRSTEYMLDTMIIGSSQPLPANGYCSLSSDIGDQKFQCNFTDQNANSWLFEYDHVSLLNETHK